MHSNSNIKPPIFIDLGDGSYHYNYDIREVEVEDELKKRSIEYTYKTVHFWSKPKYETIVNAVIRARYDEAQELSLINKYNAFVLGLSKDPLDKAEYKAYLAEIIAIKQMVSEDLK